MFLQNLAEAASHLCKLRRDVPILLGVSGGADSLALMLGLEALGYDLVIAHVDHALRPESGAEANFVQRLADSKGWPFLHQRIDVDAVAKKERLSIEEAAREVRYRFLFAQAHRKACQAVAVGHHADDQVETIIMHFLRGTALSGLRGMPFRRLMPQWDAGIPLVRPLLGIWRDEIAAYVNSFGIKPCFDASNLDTKYYRNRLRQELIPELETYNPQFKSAILRMADVLDEEANWMDELTNQAYRDCVLVETEDRIQIDLSDFQMFSKAQKRRILRHVIKKLRPDLRDIGFEAINRGLDFALNANSGDQIDFIARLNLAVIHDVLIAKTWSAELPDFNLPLVIETSFKGNLDFEKPINLKHGWQIIANLLPKMPLKPLEAVKNLSNDEAWLDFDCLTMPLKVRAPVIGERFQPLGMGGHSQSMQDLFINRKVPAHLRPFWPLVISGERIAWVVGLFPSEAFKITGTTQHILQIKIKKAN